MAMTNTSIRIDEDIRYYAKMAARKEGFTFVQYYQELILKDLRDNHVDFFKEYLECKEIDKVPDDVRYKKSLSKAIADGKEIKDINGIVIQAAKTPEEIEEHKKKYGLL